jgi:hypothetical protein
MAEKEKAHLTLQAFETRAKQAEEALARIEAAAGTGASSNATSGSATGV